MMLLLFNKHNSSEIDLKMSDDVQTNQTNSSTLHNANPPSAKT